MRKFYLFMAAVFAAMTWSVNAQADDDPKVFGLAEGDLVTIFPSGEENANSYAAATGIITFGGTYYSMGWNFEESPIDLTGYDKLVIKLGGQIGDYATPYVQFRMFDNTGFSDKYMYSIDVASNATEVTIDLNNLSHTGTGENVNSDEFEASKIYGALFWTSWENNATDDEGNQTRDNKIKIESITLYKNITIDSSKKFATVTPITGTLDFSKADGVTAYVAVENDGNYVLQQTNTIAAGEGALLYAASGCTDVYVPESETEVTATEGNKFVGVTEETTVNNEEESADINYILYSSKFYKAVGNLVTKGKAYLQLPAETDNTAIKFGIIEVEGASSETTGISEVATAESATDGVYYNLSGMRVNNPSKGVYIVNGKKVIIK